MDHHIVGERKDRRHLRPRVGRYDSFVSISLLLHPNEQPIRINIAVLFRVLSDREDVSTYARLVR